MHRLLIVSLFALLMVACTAPGPAPTASPGPTPPLSPSPDPASPSPDPASPSPVAVSPTPGGELDAIIGDWTLEEGTLDGQPIPIVPEAPITLTVNAVRIGGTSACNEYGADWVVTEDGSVEIDDVTMTLMLCEGPINDSEQAYLAALGRTTSVGLDANRLVFAGENAELRFVPSEG
jgi:heat shock protein HslJ